MTDDARPTPFALLFADAPVVWSFDEVREQLLDNDVDPADRDALWRHPAFLRLMREYVVVNDPPEHRDAPRLQHVLPLLHHGFLFWWHDVEVYTPDAEHLRAVLAGPESTHRAHVEAAPDALYVQLPEPLMPARIAPHAALEPLDGVFIHRIDPRRIRVLAILGLDAGPQTVATWEAEGERPEHLARADGTSPFAPTPGTGGAHAVVGKRELLALGWRLLDFAGWVEAAFAEDKPGDDEGA